LELDVSDPDLEGGDQMLLVEPGEIGHADAEGDASAQTRHVRVPPSSQVELGAVEKH
jgi:hypothetical protein